MPPAPEVAGEQRPLLGNGTTADNGTIERAARPSAPKDEPEISTLGILSVMGSIYLGTFLAALDSTLVATLSAPISSEFGSLSLLSWLASAYFISNAALQPLAGKLTDIFGRRAGLVFSNVFFAAGNLICGLAQTEWVIILGRVIAGMGGGGLTAISTFVASDLIPLRRRGIWQGFGNICFGVGSATGAIFGGFVNDQIGWRWGFLILVPLTIIALLLVIFLVKIPVKETGEDRWKRIDYLGALLLVATLVVLLVGLNSGGNIVPWNHPLVLTTLPLSAVLLATFVYVEANIANEPVIPVRLLANRTVLAACFTNWLDSMAYFGMIFYIPIYYQVQGDSTSLAGAKIAPNAVGIAMGSIAVGILMRWLGRYWWISAATQAILAASYGLLASLRDDTPAALPYVYLFFNGLGHSGMLTCTLVGLIAAVEHEHQAVVTSASYAFRSTGTTIGITIASAVFQNVLSSELWERLGGRRDAATIIPKVRDSLGEVKKLKPYWRDLVIEAYVDSIRTVFLTLLAIAATAAVISLFMREKKLHNTISRRDS